MASSLLIFIVQMYPACMMLSGRLTTISRHVPAHSRQDGYVPLPTGCWPVRLVLVNYTDFTPPSLIPPSANPLPPIITTTSRPTAFLTNLPREMLDRVVCHLDRSDVRSLALVAPARISPALDLSARRGLCRLLNLSINPYYGYSPSIEPELSPEAEYETYRAQIESTEQIHQAGVCARVLEVARQVEDAQGWSAVEEIRMVPRPGAVAAMVEILGRAGFLRKLAISHPQDDDWERRKGPADMADLACIDLPWLLAGLNFPSLTHVHVERASYKYPGFIPLLVNSAPYLNSLDATIALNVAHSAPDQLDPTSFPGFVADDTQITTLRLHLFCRYLWDDLPDDQAHTIAFGLLDRIPLIEKLCIDYDYIDIGLAERIWQMASQYRHLTDLIWGAEGYYRGSWPSFNKLEIVLFSYPWWAHSQEANRPIEVNVDDFFAAHSMIPSLASRLRQCPLLHTLILDWQEGDRDAASYHLRLLTEMEHRPKLGSGSARSYRHGASELLHVHSQTNRYEIADHPASASSGRLCREHEECVNYPTEDGTEYCKVFGSSDETVVQDWTDFDGLVVPLLIIQEMKEAEGAGVEWENRGVEVGEAGWIILLQWQEMEMARLELAEEDAAEQAEGDEEGDSEEDESEEDESEEEESEEEESEEEESEEE
ncbi:uncharacterized protein MKK02DRAFT_45277 [Dioszegia hungarica]|uniref:F-box domain-containing protein n=1 Tax=Dioszegia hungarica TaxID=4972 RepID=A0AA38H8R5_9TREE|nr:uncharacterized protein MKK02DRAFT_45277 [Dioszegia hungarica]KAI9636572.1 hypothetical protein MKK02DRAFT_45277 [Dioszegia hungarica]